MIANGEIERAETFATTEADSVPGFVQGDDAAAARLSGATETGRIGAAPGEDRCPALISGDGALRTARPTSSDFARACGMRPEESSGGVLGLMPLGDNEPHGTNGVRADQLSFKPQTKEAEAEAEAEGGDRLKPGLQTLCGGGVGRPPDDWRIQEANRRQRIIEEFDLLIERGLSKKQAAAAVGQGHVTIYRWEKRFTRFGFNGLLPKTDECGRKTIWEKLGFTKEQFDRIMEQVRGLNLDLKSVTAALRLYAHSDKCPADLARVILDSKRCSKHALPPSLREGARIGTQAGGVAPLYLAHRGPRALALKGAWTPRRLDILPGDIFSSDDTTPIWGFWVPWREDGDATRRDCGTDATRRDCSTRDCSTGKDYPFGVKLMQGQLLPMIDVGSQAIINFALIARESSSYRASDIWSLFGHTFATVGLPRLGFQLERGSWESNLIRGQEVEYREREVTMSRRVGGLRQLPTNVTRWHKETSNFKPQASSESHAEFPFPKTLQTWTSYLPKSKSIEAFFQRCQTFEGTIWGCLGRDQMRAPFEKTKKIYEACRRGAADPRLHFLSQEELVKRLNDIIGYINHEPMEGEIFKGVPIQKFEQAVREYPLFHVEPELQWLYRRDWSVTQVVGYFVRVRLTDPMTGERYSLFYANPEVFARHSGEAVAVYYDRENFESPAQIILARTREYLCEASYEERKGSFLGADQSGHDMRRRWKNAVMTVYSTLVKHAPSRQVPPELTQRREEAKAQGKAEVGEGKAPEGWNQNNTRDARLAGCSPKASRSATVTVDGRPVAELQGRGGRAAAELPWSLRQLIQEAEAEAEKE